MNLTLDLHGNIALDAYFPGVRRRTLQVSPEGGFFDHKDFHSAASRSRHGDYILIPTGIFSTGNFHKSLEIAALRGSEAVLVPEGNTLTLSSEILFFRGLTFGTEDGVPLKIEIKQGLVIFMDCHIHGELVVEGAKTEVALTRCRFSDAEIGVHLKNGASAILHSTALSDCRTGIRAEDGSGLDLHFCRFSNCQSPSAESPGVGVQAGHCDVKISGCHFIENDIAITLRLPQRASISNSSFDQQKLAGMFIEGDASTEKIRLQNCKFQRQTSPEQAQLTGITVHLEVKNCEFTLSSAGGIRTEGGSLKIDASRVDAKGAPGIQANGTVFSAEQTQFDSPAVAVEIQGGESHFNRCMIQGDIRENDRLLTWQTAPNFLDCQPLSEWRTTHSDQEPLNSFLQRLDSLAGLSKVKSQVEQLLRELQGNVLCRQAGQPVTLAPYRFFMAGDPGSGRSTVTELLTDTFVKYGIASQGHTVQCSFHDLISYDEQGLRILAESVRGGILLIRRTRQPIATLPEQQRQSIPERRLKLKRLHDLIGSYGVIIVHGDRTMLRQLIAGDEPLRKIFRLFFDFPPYTSAELASIVIHLCRTHQIEVSDECVLKLDIGFHVTHDRKDRRYQNATGAEELFQSCQTRYLERASHLGRVDHQLLPEDIVFPYDRAIAEILTASPAFVSKCTHCDTLNPWQVALPSHLICSGCNKIFKPETGTWLGRNSLPPPEEEAPQPEPRQRFTHRRIADIT